MPSHVPRNEPIRKREILQKRENELWHKINNKSPIQKLNFAAERVREAQLNYIKAQMHIIEVFREEDITLEKQLQRKKLNGKKHLRMTLTIGEIIELYSEYGT